VAGYLVFHRCRHLQGVMDTNARLVGREASLAAEVARLRGEQHQHTAEASGTGKEIVTLKLEQVDLQEQLIAANKQLGAAKERARVLEQEAAVARATRATETPPTTPTTRVSHAGVQTQAPGSAAPPPPTAPPPAPAGVSVEHLEQTLRRETGHLKERLLECAERANAAKSGHAKALAAARDEFHQRLQAAHEASSPQQNPKPNGLFS